MLNDCENEIFSNLSALEIEVNSHNNIQNNKNKIGQIIIDISMFKQYKIIEGYYHIFPLSNANNHNNNDSDICAGVKLGQVYIRVLPQFSIPNSIASSECNESILTDAQSVLSNTSNNANWNCFNKFVSTHHLVN